MSCPLPVMGRGLLFVCHVSVTLCVFSVFVLLICVLVRFPLATDLIDLSPLTRSNHFLCVLMLLILAHSGSESKALFVQVERMFGGIARG